MLVFQLRGWDTAMTLSLYRQRTCLHSDFEHLFSIYLLRRRALHLHDTEVWINGCRSWSLHRPQAQAYWMPAILSRCYLFSATENWVTYLVAGAGPLGSLFSDFQYPPALHSFPFSVIYAYWFEACKVRVSDLWLFSLLQHQGSLVWSHKISFKMAPSPSLQVTQRWHLILTIMTKFEVEDIDSSKFWEERGDMSRSAQVEWKLVSSKTEDWVPLPSTCPLGSLFCGNLCSYVSWIMKKTGGAGTCL